MERDSALIFEFAILNSLVLNPDKTKLIRFIALSPAIRNDFKIFVKGNLISEDHNVKYLELFSIVILSLMTI